MSLRIPLWLAAFLLGASGFVFAIEVHHLAPEEKIVLDGRLDEPAWQRAKPVDEFWESSPQANIPAKVRTEARFLYDRQALYVGVRAFDPDMSRLRAPFARRDNVLSDQDMIVLFIDPVGNRKFAHFFRVNPRGSIGDGLYNDDTSTEDFSPDIEFEVVTGRFDGGWTAEFRIPFSSLRYTDPPSKQWSAMVYRVWPREQLYRMASSMLPREQTCFVCFNDFMTGLDDLPAARLLELTPNVTLRTTSTKEGDGPTHRENDVVPSLDMKWRPRADLVVDATINPDFSQVELDTPQLAGNTQFALFFPEKRPFFLEGADILQAPFQAIYTRSVTDPAWGVRATQRTERFDGTVLVTRDEGGGLVLLPSTYTTNVASQDFKSTASFARGRWQLDKQLTAGALFTDRTLDGGAYNRVVGPDVVWLPNDANRFRVQALGSWTTAQPTADGGLAKGELTTGHLLMADWVYNSSAWTQYLDVEGLSKDFRADNGFIVQNGYSRVRSETARKFLDRYGFNEITPYVNLERRWAPDGNVQYGENYFGVRFGLPRATLFWIEGRPNSNVAVQPGAPRKRDQLSVGGESNPFPWLAKIHVEYTWGDRLDVANNRIGRGYVYNVQANLRPHPRAEVEYRLDNDVINSREPVEGSSMIIGQRVQQLVAYWHFTAVDNVRLIWQGIGIRRAPSLWAQPVAARENQQRVSLVYGHRVGIGKTFYVGANFARDRIPDLGVHTDKLEIFTKASWSFDVL
jgi:hypothetical protein